MPNGQAAAEPDMPQRIFFLGRLGVRATGADRYRAGVFRSAAMSRRMTVALDG